MHFEKWQAVGNDFMLVVASTARAQGGEAWLVPERVRRWCDRRHGVGADGVLVLDALDSATPSMAIFNADGSRAEMCGNGLRCAAAYVAEQQGLGSASVTIQTDVGARPCEIVHRAHGSYDVSVGMGVARVGSCFSFAHDGRDFELVSVDVGNPHAVTFEADTLSLVDELGPSIDRSTEGGSNVEFCRVVDGGRRIEVTVFERGVGRTLACGTGACAAAAAAVDCGLCKAGHALDVSLPGGVVKVTVEATGETGAFRVQLRGPARRVFAGELDQA